MEQVEFWIWEHAMKYGMSKVIERIHVDYGKSLIPNSWITALFLQETKNSWESSQSKITFNEVNALRQLLSSTYKHYKDSLTAFLETKHIVEIDLTLRAVFLVLRSSSSDSALVKKRARDELFPVWNTDHWEKIKEKFYIKGDVHQMEIKQFYSQLRSWLACEKSHKNILQTFDSSIKEHFPVLIKFMRRIKLSMLERMKAKNVAVPAHLEFLSETLAKATITDETTMLQFLDVLLERKVNSIGARFLKLKKGLHPGKPENVIGSTLYTIPSAFRSINNNTTSHLYPSCFDRHPFMPSVLWLKADNRYEKIVVNRVHPRDKSGVCFEPFWFASTSLSDPKAEKKIRSEDDNEDVSTQNSPREEAGKLCRRVAKEEADPKSRAINAEPQTKNLDLSSEPLSSPNRKDREQGEVNVQVQQDEVNQPVQETQSSKAEFYQTGLSSFRRCYSLDSREQDKTGAEMSSKRPRLNSVGESEVEASYHANSISLPIELDAETQRNLGHARDVTESSEASNDVNLQSSSKLEQPSSLHRVVQELSEHSSQLQKLDVDSESGILSSLLSRLKAYKRKLL